MRDGMEVLHPLRAGDSQVPMLVITARDTVADCISGLDAGADAFMVKPFEIGSCRHECAQSSGAEAALSARRYPMVCWRRIQPLRKSAWMASYADSPVWGFPCCGLC